MHRSKKFQIGDEVWIKKPNRQSKLADKYEGPYDIIKNDKDIYELKHSTTNKILTRHVSKMKPFNDRKELIVNTDTKGVSKPVLTRSTSWVMKITTVIPILLFLITCSTQIELNRNDPIGWTTNDHSVLTGKANYEINVRYNSPCSIMDQLNDIDEKILSTTISECQRTYGREIQKELFLFVRAASRVPTIANHKLGKRAVLEFFVGWFLSNVLDTAYSVLWLDHPNAKQTEEQEAILKRVNTVL